MKMELSYTGDYPGQPVVRLNGQLATSEQHYLLIALFNVRNLRELFDRVGAEKIRGSEEHKSWCGKITAVTTPI